MQRVFACLGDTSKVCRASSYVSVCYGIVYLTKVCHYIELHELIIENNVNLIVGYSLWDCLH